MITVERSISQEEATVSYLFKDEGYDHEYQGRPCHAVQMDGVEGEYLKHHLRLLGYEHIGCGVKPTFTGAEHVEYWAKAGV